MNRKKKPEGFPQWFLAKWVEAPPSGRRRKKHDTPRAARSYDECAHFGAKTKNNAARSPFDFAETIQDDNPIKILKRK